MSPTPTHGGAELLGPNTQGSGGGPWVGGGHAKGLGVWQEAETIYKRMSLSFEMKGFHFSLPGLPGPQNSWLKS